MTRLTTPPKLPPLPAGKFEHCDGQLAMDVFSDDPDAPLVAVSSHS
jgi:hypothetical protein